MYPRSLLSFLLICTAVSSESLDSLSVQQPEAQSCELSWFTAYMDDLEHYLSKKVNITASNLDRLIGEDHDQNASQENDYRKPPSDERKETFLLSTGFNDFFKDETYLDVTNRSYVKVQAGYVYDKRGDSELFHGITARLRLPKTQKQLQLFIGREQDGIMSLNNVRHEDTGIGVKYYMNSLHSGLFSRASIGISGIDNPYVKTNIEYPLYFENWLIRPVQTFKYSARDKFDEWTDLYFDRKVSQTKMVRLLLERSTNSEIKGMHYLSQLSYLNAYSDDISLNSYLGMNGRTKDLGGFYDNNTTRPKEGVYEYTVGVTLRHRLWKDYVFYQIDPQISYHEQYDYKPNPIIRIGLEIYFGNN